MAGRRSTYWWIKPPPSPVIDFRDSDHSDSIVITVVQGRVWLDFVFGVSAAWKTSPKDPIPMYPRVLDEASMDFDSEQLLKVNYIVMIRR